MSIPLLQTKFHFPVARPYYISRSHLLERLNHGLIFEERFSRCLTMIAAPAGYGKTSLAAEWLRNARLKTAWLSLDETDNDPAGFFAYFITALRKCHPSLGEDALRLLLLPQPSRLEVVLTGFLNEVSGFDRACILCLDDYHEIHNQVIHKAVAFILDHQPENLHLVITTREDPLLPTGRLRARDHLLEIRQQDLQFSTQEIARFIEERLGRSLSPEQIAGLERRTEGWVAGLQLAAISMEGRSDLPEFVREFSGSNRYVLDYLIVEVLARQDPWVQDFLIRTSILERLSGQLCDAVLEGAVIKGLPENTSSAGLLELLEQNNLFIIPLDESRTWFRYHRLFAELLRHRLQGYNPAEIPALHQRASDWFRDQGYMPEAIRHAIQAQDWDRAADLIEKVSNTMLKRGETATLIRWLEAFPEPVLRSKPKLCLDYCWPLILSGQFDRAEPWLAYLEAVAGKTPTFLGEVYAAQAFLARGAGDHRRMVETSEAAMALLEKDPAGSRGLVALNLGLAYWHMGNLPEAEAALAEALSTSLATDNTYMRLTAIIFQGRIMAVRGDLQKAAAQFSRAIELGGRVPINALAHLDLATMHYEWDQLEEASAHLEQAVHLSEAGGNDEFLVACRMMESRVQLALENLVAAGHSLKSAWKVVEGGNIPDLTVARLQASQALFDTASQGETGASQWVDRLEPHVDCHPFYRFLGLTKARLLLEAGRPMEADALLSELAEIAAQKDWGYATIAVRTWQACAEASAGRRLRLVSQVLEGAEEEGFVRTIAEGSSRLAPLLEEAARRGSAPILAGQILSAIGHERPGRIVGSPVDGLSPRELEVLRLVAAGLSNRKIGGKLTISLGTAKTHVHNICSKLAVSSRTEAAVKAKDLGLI